jgi:selenocysteine lyase/cysteine desulfurase
VTGRISDVAPLFENARAQGAVTLLDASQTLGHIPVNATELCADMVAVTGHKGLRGPTGTGALYVAEGLCLRQVYVGGTGVRSDLELHPPEMPMRLEAGTPNIAALAGLAAALQWHQAHGADFTCVEHSLAVELRSGLEATAGVHVYPGGPDDRRVGIVSFTIDSFPVEDVAYVLAESFGIICRCGLHCAPLIHAAIGSAPEGTIRFSVSGANTQDEIAAAIDAVRKLAA